MNTTQKLIHKRRLARFQREQAQTDLIPARELHKASIAAKLIGLAEGRQFENFQRCGVEELYARCQGCGKDERFFYNCNRKWCPRCTPRLAAKRAAKLRLWARTIAQPKHLVLTMKNFPVLTRTRIRQFQKALLKMRKQKIWAPVRGGCASLEITNEGRGWHLHAHILLDCRFLGIEKVAQVWGALIGQDFGIVKIKDCRGSDYVNEVAKYVCKGSELAKWPGEQIFEFINAIKGLRFFFAFGTLFKMSREIKRQINLDTPGRKVCECGCDKIVVLTEYDIVMAEIDALNGVHRRRKF